jgi:hypothetical protein
MSKTGRKPRPSDARVAHDAKNPTSDRVELTGHWLQAGLSRPCCNHGPPTEYADEDDTGIFPRSPGGTKMLGLPRALAGIRPPR